MKKTLLSIYVATVMALAAGMTAWFANDYPLADAAGWIGVLMWTLAVGPQSVAFPRQRVQITMSDCFVFYAILVHGPLAALAAAFVGTYGAMQLGESKPNPRQAAFNLGAVPLAAGLAAVTFESLGGGSHLALNMLAAATVFSIANTVLVAGAQALEGKPAPRKVLSFPALAFIGSVFATAAAGALLALAALQGPGDYAVAGVVVVGFLGGKVLTSLRDQNETSSGSEESAAPDAAEAQATI